MTTSPGKDVEKREAECTAPGNVNDYRYCRK
jgi:hypothetical protein